MSSFDAIQSHPNMQSLQDYLGFSTPMSMSRRSRIQRACIACRRRKIKCNGNLDGCAHCAEKDQKCRYEPVPDDEKLKARSYKRQLIHRRQQTRVYFGRRQFPDPMMFAAAYGMPSTHVHGMTPFPTGFYTCEPTFSSPPQMSGALLASPFTPPSTSSPMDQDLNPFFAAVTTSESSNHLQSITGTSAFPHPIPAPLMIEPLTTPALSSSLSSPTLSVSSSASSLLTPMSETFSGLNTPLTATFPPVGMSNPCASGQTHFHDFVGGLELYNVPCMSNGLGGSVPSFPTTDELVMMDTPAPSAGSSAFSTPEQFLPPLPSTFGYVSSLESAAARSALAGALA